MSDRYAYAIVNRIVADIKDRRGLKWEWNAIDDDIQKQIKEEWVKIIKEECE